ncbi:hypothetical protein QQS45_08295 [Alteriqipengyuania flavescens]|uniref:hypothetical protein n=1 Tax=Alteriqipengyuania flavescens TaxID=3053610 RepID=UPI0025B5EA07|nr:hypothetical protein [Alteriqipengyuania flavescens]WJY17647.1 hypothetical protein QQW98_08290 [Alteriqipengyuania flavescens]WJY23590.1 hypothetical protein QQS45_08295 [Alteriqipengyuania flavescens]
MNPTDTHGEPEMLTRTHCRRADGLRAELLADRDGTALYRIDAPRRVGRGRNARIKLDTRITCCRSVRFRRDFMEAA